MRRHARQKAGCCAWQAAVGHLGCPRPCRLLSARGAYGRLQELSCCRRQPSPPWSCGDDAERPPSRQQARCPGWVLTAGLPQQGRRPLLQTQYCGRFGLNRQRAPQSHRWPWLRLLEFRQRLWPPALQRDRQRWAHGQRGRRCCCWHRHRRSRTLHGGHAGSASSNARGKVRGCAEVPKRSSQQPAGMWQQRPQPPPSACQ